MSEISYYWINSLMIGIHMKTSKNQESWIKMSISNWMKTWGKKDKKEKSEF